MYLTPLYNCHSLAKMYDVKSINVSRDFLQLFSHPFSILSWFCMVWILFALSLATCCARDITVLAITFGCTTSRLWGARVNPSVPSRCIIWILVMYARSIFDDHTLLLPSDLFCNNQEHLDAQQFEWQILQWRDHHYTACLDTRNHSINKLEQSTGSSAS